MYLTETIARYSNALLSQMPRARLPRNHAIHAKSTHISIRGQVGRALSPARASIAPDTPSPSTLRRPWQLQRRCCRW